SGWTGAARDCRARKLEYGSLGLFELLGVWAFVIHDGTKVLFEFFVSRLAPTIILDRRSRCRTSFARGPPTATLGRHSSCRTTVARSGKRCGTVHRCAPL